MYDLQKSVKLSISALCSLQNKFTVSSSRHAATADSAGQMGQCNSLWRQTSWIDFGTIQNKITARGIQKLLKLFGVMHFISCVLTPTSEMKKHTETRAQLSIPRKYYVFKCQRWLRWRLHESNIRMDIYSMKIWCHFQSHHIYQDTVTNSIELWNWQECHFKNKGSCSQELEWNIWNVCRVVSHPVWKVTVMLSLWAVTRIAPPLCLHSWTVTAVSV